MKRFALLLAAMFVASMVLVAPVFASSNDDNNNGDNEIVCVGYNYDDGDKDYRWIYEEDWKYGDEVVADKYCENYDHDNIYDHDNYGPEMPHTPPPAVVPPPLLS
jgi:hypothetical protein